MVVHCSDFVVAHVSGHMVAVTPRDQLERLRAVQSKGLTEMSKVALASEPFVRTVSGACRAPHQAIDPDVDILRQGHGEDGDCLPAQPLNTVWLLPLLRDPGGRKELLPDEWLSAAHRAEKTSRTDLGMALTEYLLGRLSASHSSKQKIPSCRRISWSLPAAYLSYQHLGV